MSTPAPTNSAAPTGRTILVLSQVYPPDPASVGQHMADVCAALAERGHRVIVATANRGYDDPSKRYQSREMRDGVDVRRVPFSSFGKSSIPLRALAMLFFMGWCLWYGLTTRKLSGILVSTSPPMCGLAAGIVHTLRRTPITYWVMDLNPDQMIELGKMKPSSPAARILNWIQKFVLKRAAHVVPLDRFMADRLWKKYDASDKATIMPPWPHEDVLDVVKHDENWFRDQHDLNERFVFMYSGNHGYSTPITTLLQAALKMQDDEHILFMFIGGGVGKKEVDDTIAHEKPRNIVSLPYQPFKDLRFSLSAADVHMVTVGANVVGVVHPCKIYGAMAVARPILLCAPDPCHASDIVRDRDAGWHISNGDVDGAVELCRKIAAMTNDELHAMGLRGQRFIADDMQKVALCGQFCDIVENTLR